jgi:hypothetical protein
MEISCISPQLTAVWNEKSANVNNSFAWNVNFKKNLKYENVQKMKNKPDPTLLRTSYLSNEIKKGYQNLMRLSLLNCGYMNQKQSCCHSMLPNENRKRCG